MRAHHIGSYTQNVYLAAPGICLLSQVPAARVLALSGRLVMPGQGVEDGQNDCADNYCEHSELLVDCFFEPRPPSRAFDRFNRVYYKRVLGIVELPAREFAGTSLWRGKRVW